MARCACSLDSQTGVVAQEWPSTRQLLRHREYIQVDNFSHAVFLQVCKCPVIDFEKCLFSTR